MDANIEAKQIDKSKWGPGPWQSEPDHVDFRAHGFPCILHRQPRLGHWCGYVGVPPGHPWHGLTDSGTYDAETNEYTPTKLTAEAHGGITYAKKCVGPICHVPAPGESDDVWWLGFDCAHLGDKSPGNSFSRSFGHETESYWTVEQVRAETERLAKQASEAASR